jgi:hypothetical protein
MSIASPLPHLNFLEIGTSDFNALGPTSKAPGISVEAIGAYQRRLFKNGVPAGIRPINAAAVSDAELRAGKTKVTFYFVSPDDVQAYKLPSTIKGMSSLGFPSREALRILSASGLKHLMRNVTVPTTSYSRLTEGIASLGFVKLDMEGAESAILQDLADVCRTGTLCPTHIKYERIHMAKNSRGAIRRELAALNYTMLEHCSDPGGAFDCRFTLERPAPATR